jgi:hypothetical protein
VSRDESRTAVTPGVGRGTAARRAGERRDDEPVLPVVSRDETREAWGDEHDGRDDEWYRRERPPHHE